MGARHALAVAIGPENGLPGREIAFAHAVVNANCAPNETVMAFGRQVRLSLGHCAGKGVKFSAREVASLFKKRVATPEPRINRQISVASISW